MAVYKVSVKSMQEWTYVYEVEAENAEEAESKGLHLHEEGEESIDNWVDGETMEIREVVRSNE